MSYPDTDKSYEEYIIAVKELEDSDDIKKEKAKSFSYKPKISIITPVYNTDEKWLSLAIESVINQIYDNWELCIADGGSTEEHVRRVLDEYVKRDNRIKVKFLSENTGISGNSNEALSLATGEFIGFLDHDDELSPAALYEVIAVLNEDKNIDFVYTDENKISIDGKRFNPHFKPDWSPDMFRSYNYIGHFAVIRRRIIDEIGGFKEGFDGSDDYDLYLRVVERTQKIIHIPKILYHRRGHEPSTIDTGKIRDIDDSAKKALKEHIQRTGLIGDIYDGPFQGTYLIKYKVNDSSQVTIIIPTKDKVEILRKCIESILNRSTYDNYKILIVDNQSTEERTFEYYKEIETNPKIRVIKYDRPFNFAAINNYAVTYADSEYIIFLNNDTEVISPDWIENMLGFAQRGDVGAVGALLYHPDDTIQHAGVIIGINGITSHPFKNLSRDSLGYIGRAKITQNLSAITGACLMTKKSIFNEAGGFDEAYSYTFNDIDLCLKIRGKGYLIVYTPGAELYHHEFLTRGHEDETPLKLKRYMREISLFLKRWKTVIEKGDPYYNPNLSLITGDYLVKNNFEIFCDFPDIYTYYATQKSVSEYLKNLEDAINYKDDYIIKLENTIRDKNDYIIKLENVMKNMEDAIKGKNDYIVQLEGTIRNMDDRIIQLENILKDRVTELEHIIDDKDVQIKHLKDVEITLQSTLNNIYSSRGWKVLSFYYKVRNKILNIFSGSGSGTNL